MATAGSTLTITGSGLDSPDGRIVALFDGQPASTSCPSEERCLVTVPAGTGSVVVEVETQFGRSNGLTFHYR